MTKTHLCRALSVCGTLAPLTMIAFIFLAANQIPGYCHIADTVSKLSDQGSGRPELMTAGFISYGALIVAFSGAVYLRLQRGVKACVVWFAFTLYGISMILAGVFQDSPDGSSAPLNTEGILHNAAIIASCLAFLVGMWVFAATVYRSPLWRCFTWSTIGASFLGLVLSIVFLVQSQIPASGLLQCRFYLVMLIWIEVVSIWMLRLSFNE